MSQFYSTLQKKKDDNQIRIHGVVHIRQIPPKVRKKFELVGFHGF